MRTKRKLDIEINQEVNDIITAVQNDTKSRYLDIQLFNNGVVVDLTEHKVRVYGFKADKKNFWNDCKIEDAENGRILLELTTQMLALADVIHLQIKIYNNEETEILSTQIFKVWGTKDLFNNEAVESSNEYGSVVNLFQDVFEVRMQIKEILDKIGEPGSKGEELQKKTLFEQMEWLIDFSQKNSVGSLGEKIDEIKTRIDVSTTDWRILKKLKIKNWNTGLKTQSKIEILTVNGAGSLIMCPFSFEISGAATVGDLLTIVIEIDEKKILNLKLQNSQTNLSQYKSVTGIMNPTVYNRMFENESKELMKLISFQSSSFTYPTELKFYPYNNGNTENNIYNLTDKEQKVNITTGPVSLYTGTTYICELGYALITTPLKFNKSLKVYFENSNVNIAGYQAYNTIIYTLDE